MVEQAAAAASWQGEAVVDGRDQVWLPYDLPWLASASERWRPLSARRSTRHAGRAPFRWPASDIGSTHVLNGMGVALGDAVIGGNALAWTRLRYPARTMHLYRSPHAPAFVERLYALALRARIVHSVHYLPQPLSALPEHLIDVSDILHWPDFARLPMVDFFFQSLGLDPRAVPAWAKANRWLNWLPLPDLPAPWARADYVLFCANASTALRSVPPALAAAWVARIWEHYRLPVLGFGPVRHPQYRDVAALSPRLDDFIAWVRSARALVAGDSAAVHIGAGFDVPTLAVFTSIAPALRTRDYPCCQAVDARTATSDGLHASDDPELLADVGRRWQALIESPGLPWPAPRPRRGTREGSLGPGRDRRRWSTKV